MGQLTEILKQGYAAFMEGDLDGATRDFADDIVWKSVQQSDVPWQQPKRGIEAVKNSFMEMGADLEFTSMDIVDILEVGNTVVLRVDTSFNALKTGNIIESTSEVHWWTFNDDKKAVSVLIYLDSATMDKAMGVNAYAHGAHY